jgi:methanol--5-hydroxybenzimidazolylcobamide Co-methyltransferase
MNTATAFGKEKTLRDLYMFSDRARGPEGYVLAYDNAYKIGEAIVAEGKDIYRRARAAGLTGAKIIRDGHKKKEILLTAKQKDVLDVIIKTLDKLPEEESKFVDYCMKQYKDVPAFNPKNYDL